MVSKGEDDEIFGYSPRFDEYRSKPDMISGELVKDTYDEWHLARRLNASPVLNSGFITCEPSGRVFQSQTDPHFVVDMAHDITAIRPVGKRMR